MRDFDFYFHYAIVIPSMQKQPYTFIFTGPQGAGKGTQVSLLKEYLINNTPQPVFHVETGMSFRALVEGTGYTQDQVRETLQKGELQPTFLAVWMWANTCINQLNKNDHMIFDGSPRSILEAQVLQTALSFYGRTPIIISLELSQKVSEERLIARGRNDDSREGILKRLAWHQNHVIPAIEYLESQPGYMMIRINGDQTVEKVHQDIINQINHIVLV